MNQDIPAEMYIKDNEDLREVINKTYELIDTINLRTILLDLTLNYLISDVEQNKKVTDAEQQKLNI